jgi:hypothetical protein
MGNIFPAVTLVHPHYTAPESIVQWNQATGAFDLLATGDVMPRLSDDDQYVYMKVIEVRTQLAASQMGGSYNSLPSCTVKARMIQTPVYRTRVRAEYDHHDIAAGARYDVSVPDAQSKAMRQAHFQGARGALLYGYNPQNGEGILNTVGATLTNLPPDPNGNTTVLTYDNGAMAFFLLSQIAAAKQKLYQLGMPVRVVIIGPQRTLSPFEYQGIVQVTQYQREGAGSLSVRGTLETAMGAAGRDILEWNYDDTLIGKGANGTDAVIIVVPELKMPTGRKINTNEFAKLQPSIAGTSLMYSAKAAPIEIVSPLAGGATDVLSEWGFTSGWAIRPEAVNIVSMQYQ